LIGLKLLAYAHVATLCTSIISGTSVLEGITVDVINAGAGTVAGASERPVGAAALPTLLFD